MIPNGLFDTDCLKKMYFWNSRFLLFFANFLPGLIIDRSHILPYDVKINLFRSGFIWFHNLLTVFLNIDLESFGHS